MTKSEAPFSCARLFHPIMIVWCTGAIGTWTTVDWVGCWWSFTEISPLLFSMGSDCWAEQPVHDLVCGVFYLLRYQSGDAHSTLTPQDRLLYVSAIIIWRVIMNANFRLICWFAFVDKFVITGHKIARQMANSNIWVHIHKEFGGVFFNYVWACNALTGLETGKSPKVSNFNYLISKFNSKIPEIALNFFTNITCGKLMFTPSITVQYINILLQYTFTS